MFGSMRRRGTYAALGGLALVLAACTATASGGDGVASLRSPEPGGDATPAPSASADAYEAMLDYASCMREHGIDMPDPQPGDGGFAIVGEAERPAAEELPDMAGEEFRAADEACGHHLDGLAPPQLDPEQQAEMLERLLAFTSCMREHGIDMPDPKPGEGAVSLGGPGEEVPFDPTSEDFQEAQRACSSELGVPGGDAPGIAPAAPGDQP